MGADFTFHTHRNNIFRECEDAYFGMFPYIYIYIYSATFRTMGQKKKSIYEYIEAT